jgi:hypothetical protein
MPDPIHETFTSFEKLLILRTLRPDKLIPGVSIYVVN